MTTTPQAGAMTPALSPDYESYFQRYEERQRRRAELRPTTSCRRFRRKRGLCHVESRRDS